MQLLRYPKLCLASQSPRRRELLNQLGASFDVLPAHIDEAQRQDELPENYVERITREKARAVWTLPEFNRDMPVLASDTAVILGKTIFGKPTGEADGKRMLRLMSGTEHSVMTGVILLFNDVEHFVMSLSKVSFKVLSQSDIDCYWDTKEGADKAGGYAIQGMAASFIERIEGSFSGIMGLPLFETTQLLEQFNVEYWKVKKRL